MPNLTLNLLEGTYAIHRLPLHADVPEEVLASPFFAAFRNITGNREPGPELNSKSKKGRLRF